MDKDIQRKIQKAEANGWHNICDDHPLALDSWESPDLKTLIVDPNDLPDYDE